MLPARVFMVHGRGNIRSTLGHNLLVHTTVKEVTRDMGINPGYTLPVPA